MPIHDAYARRTPYELSFRGLDWAREEFSGVRDEAEARGLDRSDPALFILLGSVGRMLQDIRPEDDDPERIQPLGHLLFHEYHFWEAGERLFLVETPVVRQVMESAPSRRWSGELPARAGYVQLPQHLVWMEGEGETPESIDGFFWTAPTPGSEIHVLLAAGLHADRAGFSVVPLPPASLDRAEEWADRPGSEDGVDFRSRMPGAHFERLYRVGTPGEVLKLVSRVFAFMDDRSALEPQAPSTSTSAPRPSTLSYRRIAVD